MKPKKWLPGLPMPCYFLFFPWLLAFMLAMGKTLAQSQTVPEQGLTIGQAVPDVVFHNVVNYPAGTARLSDFKGKLLLLDFWATWCGNCKTAMPKLDAIQKEFGDQVQVLLVNAKTTNDTEEKVKAYFDRWRSADGSRYGLPSVIYDTELYALFPHRLIPHVVWIGPDGRVQAITAAEEITPENVRQALAGNPGPRAVKKDLDLNKPLYTGSQLPADNLLHYSILLKGQLFDVPSGTRMREKNGTVYGAALTNTPLLAMYEIVKRALSPELGGKGFIIEVADSASLFPEKSRLDKEAWRKLNYHSYDLIVPPGLEGDLFGYMLRDLNHYSGFHAGLEKRKMDCLVLVRRGKTDNLRTQGGKPANTLNRKENTYLKNYPLRALVSRLNGAGSPLPLVVDETGYTDNVDLVLTAPLHDLATLRKELRRYGLDLKPARRQVEVFVLRDRSNEKQSIIHYN